MTQRSTDLALATTIQNETTAALNTHARVGAAIAALANDCAFVEDVAGYGVVTAMATAALPAYATSGGPGPGFTLTAVSNGAFPTLNGTAALSVGDSFYLPRGASATDNGVFKIVSLGGVSSLWSAVLDTRFDTAAKITGSSFRIARGLRAGAQYVYTASATVVMGTTRIFWKRVDSRIGPQEGSRSRSDCTSVLTLSVNLNIAIPGTEVIAITGASTTMSSNVANTSTQRGVYSFTSGATSTTVGGFQGGFTAAVTQPDGGDTIFIAQDMGFAMAWTVTAPVLSTGTDEFAINVGYSKTRNASQKLPSDFVGFIYDRTSTVSAVNWLAVTASGGVSTGTVIDTGVPVVAGTFNHLAIIKDAGDNSIRLLIDGVVVATLSTNVPTVGVCSLCMAFKSVGAGSVNFLRVGSIAIDVDFPLELAA